jgi:hypothetical protein
VLGVDRSAATVENMVFDVNTAGPDRGGGADCEEVLMRFSS